MLLLRDTVIGERRGTSERPLQLLMTTMAQPIKYQWQWYANAAWCGRAGLLQTRYRLLKLQIKQKKKTTNNNYTCLRTVKTTDIIIIILSYILLEAWSNSATHTSFTAAVKCGVSRVLSLPVRSYGGGVQAWRYVNQRLRGGGGGSGHGQTFMYVDDEWRRQFTGMTSRSEFRGFSHRQTRGKCDIYSTSQYS